MTSGGGALGPLIPATWYMRTANDSVLPATISVRTIGVAQEETVLDSARLVVNSDGTYAQRYWLRIFVSTVLDRSEVVVDEGTWTVTSTAFQFTSTIRARAFAVTSPQFGRLTSQERMVFFGSAPTTAGGYRLTPP